MKRIDRERWVVERMIAIYCHRHHEAPEGSLCDVCASLLAYADSRLRSCPKGSFKTSCRKCEIHCYSPVMRARMREVMRDVGPRMIFHHPLAAIRHLLSEMK